MNVKIEFLCQNKNSSSKMIINVKLLNGDVISLETHIYSEQALCHLLCSDYNEGVIKIHHLHDHENGDKDVFAVFLPVHKRGRDFARVLSKLKRYVDRHLGTAARKQMRSYFRRILRLLLLGDDAVRGDSYVNEHHTALEAFTAFMLDCEIDLLEPSVSIECTNRDIILDCYGQLCRTTTDFDKVITRVCDLKIKDNYSEDYGFFEENRLVTRGRLLATINDVQEIERLANVSEDICQETEEVQPFLTYNQMLWLLKEHMMNDMVVNYDDD